MASSTPKTSAKSKSGKAVAETSGPGRAAPKPASAKLGRKLLLDRVTETTGLKRHAVRKVLDAVLTEMRDAVESDADLDLAPLGKLRVVRRREGQNGEVVICRLKLDEPAAEDGAKEPLAEPAE